jgi:hypothetical protein
MPLCPCGCNQDLKRRAIKRHLRGEAVPRLVTAVVKASQTVGHAVSPPRLNPSRKLRSSRRYFPSPPASVTFDEERDTLMSERDGAAGNRGMSVASEDVIVDDVDAQCALSAALKDVWSGVNHEDDAEDDDAEDDDAEDDDAEDDDVEDDDWEEEYYNDEEADNEYDGRDSHGNGLTALERLGEDFERDLLANGEFHVPFSVPILAYIIIRSWKVKRARHVDPTCIYVQG